MPAVVEWFENARACQRAGQLAQALALYRRVVEAAPEHAEAWQLLGDCAYSLGEFTLAVEALQRALRLRPGLAYLHCGLAQALARLGRREEAAEQLGNALRLDPHNAEASMELGVLLAEAGRLAEALPLLQQAARAVPDSAVAQHNLGVALAQAGRKQEAERPLREALRLKPDYADCHGNLGNVLRDLGRPEEALDYFRTAARLRPTLAGAFNNLGLALCEANRHIEAVLMLKHASRLDPKGKESFNNLGQALADLGKWAEAEAAYEQALRLDAGYAEALANLGSCFKEQQRLEEALACYDIALALQPESVSTHYNRSMALLQAGNYAEGWQAYDWRWQRPASPMRPFPHPRWDGSSFAGKTLLLWCEQGMGDNIHFVRYASQVKARGGTVWLECPPELMRLLGSCPGVDRVLAGGEGLPPFDLQIPLMSLPAVFGTTLETVPADIPYLAVEPERVQRWKERLAEVEGFRIGVVWQGNPKFGWDRFRSFPLKALAPLAEVEGVRLVSLQKGPGTEQLLRVKGYMDIMELETNLDEQGAFLDTSAVMQNLDLVVSADTAAAHLAGALGVPVWVAVAAVADWRWGIGKEETPWYPTMRLFRQERLYDWRPVFQRMAEELATGQARRCLACQNVPRPATVT
jgi:tetratricopeptide (TPR) repeat protein